MFERLDHAIVNSQWLLDNLNCKLHNFPTIGSEHSSILLSTRCYDQVKKNYQFKFEVMGLQHPNFNDFVKKSLVL